MKEADALSSAGYKVTVLYAYWNNWGTRYDEGLLSHKKWKAIRVAGHPGQDAISYNASRIIFKLAKAISKFIRISFVLDLAVARPTLFLIREAKKHNAAIYIAHNLGALPAAVNAAKYHNAQCGFDAEDLHRYEVSNDDQNMDVIIKSHLENKYIPELDQFTTSSQPIANFYQKLYPGIMANVILNVFPSSDINIPIKENTQTGMLKLLWFSQTIGPNRGIDDVIKALQLINKPGIELHLLGNRPPANQNYIEQIKNSGILVVFHDPIHPDNLTAFAAGFDIGLALEPAFSINNDFALSNKLFTYLQAGLAIIASNTTAQKLFMDMHPGIGEVYKKGDHEELAALLSIYSNNPVKLKAYKKEAAQLSQQQYNWETEGQKFLALVKDTLAKNE